MRIQDNDNKILSGIRNLSERMGYKFSPDYIVLFGIRDNDFGFDDEYNDYIGAIKGSDMILFNFATCDPGPYWTEGYNRERKGWPIGAAHICSGFYYNVYRAGSYRNNAAFIQHGELTIYRDVDENFEYSRSDVIQSGIFGIHIHKGSNRVRIGASSAGCQVLSSEQDMTELVEWVKKKTDREMLYDYMLLDLKFIDDDVIEMLQAEENYKE